ncbi:unnamed protein product, partial [Lymnaea stagnalis]
NISAKFDPIVTQHEFIGWMAMFSSVDILLSALGLVTNIVNMKTFLAMGADDGVTVSFLSISWAEFLCCLAAFGQKLSMALWVTEMATEYKVWFYINPYAFNSFLGNIRTCLFAMPVLITTHLALAKCLCVVKPLRFKTMFTVTRTRWIMFGIVVFSVATYVPLLATMGIAEQFDPAINATRRILWFSPYRNLIKNIIWNARDSTLAVASEVIIVICVMVMSRALADAVEFRESLKNGSQTDQFGHTMEKTPAQASMKSQPKLTGKELQVIKQVTLISLVYVVANTPKIAISLAGAMVPYLTQGGIYQYLYEVIIKGREHSELYISVANIFIYYGYNSRYRQCCKLY